MAKDRKCAKAKRKAKKNAETNAKNNAPCRTLQEKQEHVRQLAKARRWIQIKRLYGDAMVARAKIYLEGLMSNHTPASLAMDLLKQNGYVPTATNPNAIGQNAHKTIRKETRNVVPEQGPTADACTLSDEQRRNIERKRKEALLRRAQREKPMVSVIEPFTIRQPTADNARALQATGQMEMIRGHTVEHTREPVPATDNRAKDMRSVMLEQEIRAAADLFQSNFNTQGPHSPYSVHAVTDEEDSDLMDSNAAATSRTLPIQSEHSSEILIRQFLTPKLDDKVLSFLSTMLS